MVIISNGYGQLGNRLFIYANFIANAIENNYSVCNPTFHDYAHYFECCQEQVILKYPNYQSVTRKNRRVKPFIRGFVSKCFRYLSRIICRLHIKLVTTKLLSLIYIEEGKPYDLKNSRYTEIRMNSLIVLVHGWAWDDENLKRHADKIRQFFKPISIHNERITGFIGEARKKYDILIGVHIRLGDYKEFMGGKYYYDVYQYAQILRQLVVLFPKKSVGFLICSNGEYDKVAFEEFNIVHGPNHIIEDMYSLAKCDYIIGPPSTYSLWAAFYGKVPFYHIEDPSINITMGSFSNYQLD